jgi:transcriptional regulator, LacI family
VATIRDVANSAGVSTSTVSHVINRTRHVSAETRERVLNAIQALHYQPNRLARSLRNRQTTTFGVLLPNSANSFFAEVLLGIESACFDSGYSVILGNANDNAQREMFYLDVLLSKQVDGILLISTGAYREALDALMRRDTPVVLVDRSPGTLEIDTVFTDNRGGGLMATDYLLRLGHRRIGCITGPSPLAPSAERLTGYRLALQAAGISVDEALIVPGEFQHEGGYQACQRLLALAEPPTAIFACNDMMAVGALCALHEAGLRVPEEVSVVGFDDIPLASYTVPRLTTVAQPAQEIGRVAVEKLIERLQNRDAPANHVRLPVHLVERDTCKPCTR